MKTIITAIFAFCLITSAFAIDSPYLGGGFNNVNGDGGWGIRGGSPFSQGILIGRIDAKLQDTGTQLVGDAELEVGLPIASLEFLIFQVNNFDGDSIAELNRTSDLGLKVRSPEAEIGDFVFTAGLGVFGRNGGVFAGPNAESDLIGLGYSAESLEGLGLAEIGRPKDGLSTKAENSVNAQLELLLSRNDAYASLLLQPELKGQSENSVHQALLKVGTNLKLWKLVFNVEFDLGLQTWNDAIEIETATFGSFNFEF